jgi:formylglycine-generating enzyme required for sulfatase activity
VAWYEKNSGGTTHEVGTKQPNELGIYDMSGSVWEWCHDRYSFKGNSSDPQKKYPKHFLWPTTLSWEAVTTVFWNR